MPRVLEDVAVGVAAEFVTARPRLALSPPILLPRVARAVVLVAVELDRQADVRASGNRPAARRRAGSVTGSGSPAALSRARNLLLELC